MTEWIILICIGVGALYWQSAARAKEIAVAAARRECKLFDVQFLDSTAALTRLSMSRDANDNWRAWREYRFEYATDGEVRYQGRVTTLGPRVIRVALETFNPVIH